MEPATLEARLTRLERALSQTRVVLTGVVAVWMLSVTAGGPLATATSQVVTATAFHLVDDLGDIRARLDMTLGEPTLVLIDDQGKPRSVLTLTPLGPLFMLVDQTGAPILELHVSSHSSSLTLQTPGTSSQRARAVFEVVSSGPRLALLDTEGRARGVFRVDDTGPALLLADERSRPRAALDVFQGREGLTLWDAAERSSFQAP